MILMCGGCGWRISTTKKKEDVTPCPHCHKTCWQANDTPHKPLAFTADDRRFLRTLRIKAESPKP